jgi:hypothetical protein
VVRLQIMQDLHNRRQQTDTAHQWCLQVYIHTLLLQNAVSTSHQTAVHANNWHGTKPCICSASTHHACSTCVTASVAGCITLSCI